MKDILEKTLGVPLFQEQAMKLAMVAAGFTPGEADALRRALSHKRAEELLVPYRERFVRGAWPRGYGREFAEQLLRAVPRLRALRLPRVPLGVVRADRLRVARTLKCYYPAAFCAALLNSQPMGFYAPHTLVEDAKRHGVEVRPMDVRRSDWDCTLEEGELAARAARW